MNKTILNRDHISKYIFDAYGKPIKGTTIKILNDVHFDVREEEVHILIGENGAGKSTLMKILGGIIPHDEGKMELYGKEVHFDNPRQSQAMGIGFIHQELDLCTNLDVAENLFLGKEPGGFLADRKQMYSRSHEMLMQLGFDIDPHTLVRDLSTAQQQIVEIVRAVSYDSKIIIMDEPTASLTQSEIDHLFEIIRNLKKKGVSIIYISHRFEELKEIGDRLTVLRDGCYVGTMDMADFTYDKAISMMVGRRLSQMYTTKHIPQTEELLRVEGLKISPRTEPVSFHVNRGEVVGIGGLVGAGRTELAQSIFGARKFYGGRIIYAGEEIHHPTPKALIEKGLMYLTEDRKSEGLILPKSIAQNITLPSLGSLFPSTWIRPRKEKEIALSMIEKLNIICRGADQMTSTLSGGNQQKVVLAKWLSSGAKVLMLDETTRGVDVGAKAEIYAIIDELASEGVGILMISSELPELIGMSDRIYVMRRGTISAELTNKSAFTQEEILSHTV